MLDVIHSTVKFMQSNSFKKEKISFNFFFMSKAENVFDVVANLISFFEILGSKIFVCQTKTGCILIRKLNEKSVKIKVKSKIFDKNDKSIKWQTNIGYMPKKKKYPNL